MMKAKPTFSLKDQLFNPIKVEYLAGLIQSADPDFSSNLFQRDVLERLPELALKERMTHIATCLHQYLPGDYLTALNILLSALPPELDPTRCDNDFGDFLFGTFSLFVALYGCTQEHLRVSLRALREITKRFSAEYAVRFFLNAFPEETLGFLTECANDKNYHVRRLASEGTRPKLPWAQKLITDYHDALSILDLLYVDNTRFVTRSVANHLNDISKLNPEVVIEVLMRWRERGGQSEKEMEFITRHSLRTLVKKGHKGALALLGFECDPNITITCFRTDTPVVRIGENFVFALSFVAQQTQRLMIDYVMDFATHGRRAGRKVFKLRRLEVEGGTSHTIQKKHSMRRMTTRRLAPGVHTITLQVNGLLLDSLSFELVE